MSMERSGIFQFRGVDTVVIGRDIEVGQIAPEFTVQAKDWSFVKGLESSAGKVRVIGSLPSLNTSVCDRETRRFNQEAGALGEDVVILMVSMDLPYTLASWCAAADVENVVTLSAHLDGGFGEKYGVLLKDQRIFRRAIFVVDRDDRVIYADYMPVLGDEPNYEEVLKVVRSAV